MLTDTEALSPRHSLQSQSDSWALSLFHQFWEGDREGMEVISAQSWRDSHVTYDRAPPLGGKTAYWLETPPAGAGNWLDHLPLSQKKCEFLGWAHDGEGEEENFADPGGGEIRKPAPRFLINYLKAGRASCPPEPAAIFLLRISKHHVRFAVQSHTLLYRMRGWLFPTLGLCLSKGLRIRKNRDRSVIV